MHPCHDKHACAKLMTAVHVQERKVAPPDLPPIDIYKTLASLLQQVEAGHRFRPITVQDIAAAQSSAKVGDSLYLTC